MNRVSGKLILCVMSMSLYKYIHIHRRKRELLSVVSKMIVSLSLCYL